MGAEAEEGGEEIAEVREVVEALDDGTPAMATERGRDHYQKAMAANANAAAAREGMTAGNGGTGMTDELTGAMIGIEAIVITTAEETALATGIGIAVMLP